MRLEVVAGNAAGMSILVDDELVIGRHAEGAGQLAADQELSRSHARITRDSSGFVAIEDLGSTNGTFVNGLRINGPQTLSEGDSIELGATTLLVRALPAQEPMGGPTTVDPSPLADAPSTVDPPQPTVVPGSALVDSPPGGSAQTEPGIPATLAVRLEVDFAAREARILLDASEPVLLHFDGAAWRAGSSSS